ncbi:sulfotransferase [Nostoc sp. NIES-4103]|nr:sulfotransferase [Nostoc sp. NIES-4103]
MLPNFVIIGAQKSASSFMQICLADHPDIYLPEGEIPFFESPDYEDSDIKQLEKIFEGRSEKCFGIKRPNYIGKAEVPERIQYHLPNAKLIVVLRNPIDRAISAYFHNIKYGFLPPLNLERGMREILFDSSFSSKYKRATEIIEFGYYYKYLSKYSEYMKNGRLLIFLHEDIVSKPLESIQLAYNFLDVSQDFIPKSLNSRPQEVIYSLPRLQLLQHRNRFIHEYNENRTRLSLKKMTVIDKICAGVITNLDQKFLSRYLPNSKPKVGLELRKILYDLYAKDIKSLEDYLHRDLSAWKPS